MRHNKLDDELMNTLNHLATREDSEDCLTIINIVANLLHETNSDRVTGAIYERTLKHRNLRIKLEFNKE